MKLDRNAQELVLTDRINQRNKNIKKDAVKAGLKYIAPFQGLPVKEGTSIIKNKIMNGIDKVRVKKLKTENVIDSVKDSFEEII